MRKQKQILKVKQKLSFPKLSFKENSPNTKCYNHTNSKATKTSHQITGLSIISFLPKKRSQLSNIQFTKDEGLRRESVKIQKGNQLQVPYLQTEFRDQILSRSYEYSPKVKDKKQRKRENGIKVKNYKAELLFENQILKSSLNDNKRKYQQLPKINFYSQDYQVYHSQSQITKIPKLNQVDLIDTRARLTPYRRNIEFNSRHYIKKERKFKNIIQK